MQSKAKTVKEYLASLPPDRREAIEAVRAVILKNLDKDYEEGMSYGMIGYYVPHSVYPPGYHCNPAQPLPFAGLASQKGSMSLYLMCVYGGTPETEWFKSAWAKTGKKLDMGAACVRFKKVEDLALDVIGELIRRVPAKKYIERCEAALNRTPEERRKAREASIKKKAKTEAGKKSAAKMSGAATRSPRKKAKR